EGEGRGERGYRAYREPAAVRESARGDEGTRRVAGPDAHAEDGVGAAARIGGERVDDRLVGHHRGAQPAIEERGAGGERRCPPRAEREDRVGGDDDGNARRDDRAVPAQVEPASRGARDQDAGGAG